MSVKAPGPSRARSASSLRRLWPWFVAALILALLFRAVDVAHLRDAVGRVSLGAWIALIAAYVSAILVTDSFATWVLYRRSLPDVPLGYLDTLGLRGATYLLAVVHYGAGQGAMAYFLKSRHGVPLARAAGAVMLTMGTQAVTVATMAAVGIGLGGAPSTPALRLVLYAMAAGLVAYLAVVAWRPRALAAVGVLRPLFDAGVAGHAVISLARLPHMTVLIFFNLWAMHLFGIDVPAAQGVTLLPLVFVVAVLPISPSGLGTSQAMAVALFAAFAPPGAHDPEAQRATVLAYSLGIQFSSMIAQVLIGLGFLRRFAPPVTVEGEPPDGNA